jgi:hypothetical protein
MSAFRRAFLFCDAPRDDNGPFDDSSVPAAETVADARSAARLQGWHRTRDGRDICPDCWAEGER